MKLTWDNIGEKFYKVGLSHGVLYPYYDDIYHAGIAWNGLSGVDPNTGGNEVTKLYSNDMLDEVLLGYEEYGGIIRCFTYPDEFEECIGNEEAYPGVFLNNQERINFGLSYRTLVGNDSEGTDAGFTIHLIYNAIATGSESSESTFNDNVNPSEFQFTFTAIPEPVVGYNPVSHISISSRRFKKNRIDDFLDILYGTEENDPRLPTPDEILALLAPVPDPGKWDGHPSGILYPADDVIPNGGN